MSFPEPRKLSACAIGLVSVAAVLMMTLLAIQRPSVVSVGKTMQFDDFFFTVGEVRRSKPTASTSDPAAPPLVEYIVRLTIANRAKRVNFRFSDSAVVLVDARAGTRFPVDAARKRAHEDASGKPFPQTLVLKAGESVTKDYVFSVPANTTALRLKIMPGGAFGDFMQRLLGQPTDFQLP
jgi:hypothetical protein